MSPKLPSTFSLQPSRLSPCTVSIKSPSFPRFGASLAGRHPNCCSSAILHQFNMSILIFGISCDMLPDVTLSHSFAISFSADNISSMLYLFICLSKLNTSYFVFPKFFRNLVRTTFTKNPVLIVFNNSKIDVFVFRKLVTTLKAGLWRVSRLLSCVTKDRKFKESPNFYYIVFFDYMFLYYVTHKFLIVMVHQSPHV